MRRIFVVLLFLLLSLPVVGQLEVRQSFEPISLVNNSQVKALYTSPDRSFAEVRMMSFDRPYNSEDVQSVDSVLWLQFSVTNKSIGSTDYYIFMNVPYSTVHQFSAGEWQEFKSGYMLTYESLTDKKVRDYAAIQLMPYEETQIIIKLESHRLTNKHSLPKIGGVRSLAKKQQKDADYSHFSGAFSIVYITGLLIVMLFLFMLFASIRESTFVFYLLYLNFQLVHAFTVLGNAPFEFMNVVYYYPILEYTLSEPVLFIFIGFYVFFIVRLFEIPKSLLKDVAINLGRLCFAYALFSLIYLPFFASMEGREMSYLLSRLLIIPTNIILIIWIIWKVRHPLLVYFIIAHLFFFTGTILSVYIELTGIYKDPDSAFYFYQSYRTAFQIGLFGEALSFALALSIRVKFIQKEREESAVAYIAQLQKNKNMQEQMNRELDRMVSEKSDELKTAYLEMEKQHEREMKLEFSHKLNEMEMIALRSQMNPHFLFNSMNALKHLILKDRSEDAMSYLDDFSVLLRRVLQNSKKETISVDDELEVLELYLSLEKMRLGEDLNFVIDIDDKEDLSQYQTPALLLQPFVENAIWHGLGPSDKSNKLLKIKFETNDDLIITIEDNGVGRDPALLSKNVSEDHESLGLKITQDRINLYNQNHEGSLDLEIIDLMEGNLPAGTLVRFKFTKYDAIF